MHKGRSFLRHEILNLLTILNFSILSTHLSEKKKQDLLNPLKLVGILNAEESFILEQKREFFNQEVKVGEVLEMIQYVITTQDKKLAKKLEIDPIPWSIKCDANVLKQGLEHLLMALLEHSQKIHLVEDEKEKMLIINYIAQKTYQIDPTLLPEYLKGKNDYNEIFCKISVELMKANGIKVNFKKNAVEIIF